MTEPENILELDSTEAAALLLALGVQSKRNEEVGMPIELSVDHHGMLFESFGEVSEPVESNNDNNIPEEIDYGSILQPVTSNIPANLVEKKAQMIKNAKKQSTFGYVNSTLRLQGLEYQGVTRVGQEQAEGKVVNRQARSMKPPCPETGRCRKSQLFSCSKMKSEEREKIFQEFWSLKSWEAKQLLVKNSVEKSEPKKRKLTENPKENTFRYFLPCGGKRARVCPKMFSSTIDISIPTLTGWLKASQSSPDGSSRSQNPAATTKAPSDHVLKEKEKQLQCLQFLSKMPMMESHYCRKQDQKMYLERNWPSIRELHSWFCTQVPNPVCRTTFMEVMSKNNIGLHKWKKDLCNLCEIKRINMEDVVSTEHFIEKDKAYKHMEELRKKHKNDSSTLLISVDVEQALPIPKLKVDAAFFRLKLLLHNYTLIDVATKKVTCYLFTERNSTSQAEVFTSCLYEYVTEKLELNPEIKRVLIFSDNCTAQNKNQTLGNVLLKLAVNHGIDIEQHFLVAGHTHLDVDKFHSAVEKRIKHIDMHTDEDYAEAIKTALPGSPEGSVEVRLKDWTFFKNPQLKSLRSLRPGSRVGDPTVAETRAYQYCADGTVNYKLKVEDNFQSLPQKISIPANFPSPVPLFDGPRSIGDTKVKHMRELEPFIPIEKRERYRECFL